MSVVSEQYRTLRELSPENLSASCTEWLAGSVSRPDDSFRPVTPSFVSKRPGRFGWVECAGAVSKMERWSSVFSLSFVGGSASVVSCNFMRLVDRVRFFDSLLTGYDEFFSGQFAGGPLAEAGVGDVSAKAAGYLRRAGYEWAIREVRLSDVTRWYDVSWSHTCKLLLADTKVFTGVPEEKLEQIWKSKARKSGLV